jgi:TatD DNase family protein
MDIGANLARREFPPHILNLVLDHAFRVQQLHGIFITGTSVASSKSALSLVTQYAAQYPNKLFATAGIHPHDASTFNRSTLAELEQLTSHPSVKAVGETGLDLFRNCSPPEAQKASFRAHLELAIRVKKPLFLHERGSHAEFVALVEPFLPALKKSLGDRIGVVHCFTGNAEEAKRYLDMGFYIGVTGWITDRRRNASVLKALPQIPLDRLLVETDAPFLTPYPHRANLPQIRPNTNVPGNLDLVIAAVAAAHGRDVADVTAITTANARRLFDV